MTSAKPRIAIIGAGISGLGAAFALKDTAEVVVFEKRERLGGHACTVDVDYDGVKIPVDVGFIVYNTHNYKNLTPFFDHLGVETFESDMSFAVSDPNGYEWASSAAGLFAWKRNLFDMDYLRLLLEILRFNDIARADLAADTIPDVSLAAYLDQHGFSQLFRDAYLLPMGAAIWSTPEDKMLDYPAQSFINFFENHRLMHKERPTWRSVTGGSRSYVRRIEELLADRVVKNCAINRVRPGAAGKVEIITETGETSLFDDVILASHSDQSLSLLDNSYEDQRMALGSVRVSKNDVYLHRDPRLMPRRKSAWASWNVMRAQEEDRVCVSYWMNRLQNLPKDKPLFVTLNPSEPPADALTFGHYTFDHPMFDAPASAAQRTLRRIQGQDGLWFAGAWLGDGFHESGLKSGLEAALALGGRTPWTAENIQVHDKPRRTTPQKRQASARL